MTKTLDVYLHDIFVGKLIQNATGKLSFVYAAQYLEKNHLAISLSLPLRKEPYEDDLVKAFFSGFLPDDDARYKLAKYLGVSDKNSFALLEIIGGECAGALSLYPHGTTSQKLSEKSPEILDQFKLGEILELLKKRPLLAGYDDLRLSLAGAQSKIAVTVKDNQIALAHGNNPTTHILKPAIEGIDSSAYNELFCMRLAKMVGIDTPHSEIQKCNNTSYFLVERYDRIKDIDGNVSRLHQEDFCQALGLMPEIKYEREGGPSFLQCHDLLYRFSSKPAVDQRKFLERVIFNYLIGNADAHGKNFSLLYKDKKPELAPTYDLLSTAVYSNLSSKMAMKIGGKYNAEDVALRHWQQLIPNTAIAQKELARLLKRLSTNCLEKAIVLKSSLEEGGISSSIFQDICLVIEERAGRISSVLGA